MSHNSQIDLTLKMGMLCEMKQFMSKMVWVLKLIKNKQLGSGSKSTRAISPKISIDTENKAT